MNSVPPPALDALVRLREGNARFVANVLSIDSLASQSRKSDPRQRQAPVAIVLGCSDSRAPAETVFDQGLGDLFVIRVAGNIVAPSQVGSVEFAAEHFGTRLVVVMGHTHCGAISATVDSITQKNAPHSQNLLSITDRIRPAVESLVDADVGLDRPALLRAAMRANVRASANHLRHGSRLLEELILHQGLVVVGAEYDIETGRVEFFDGVD